MIDIVLSADDSYAPRGAVVIASALANTSQPESFCFYLLTPGITKDTKSRLQSWVQSRGAQIHVVEVKQGDAGSLNLGRFGQASLLRLSMHQYLPADCQKVIYLDCDLVVLGDLADLWSQPLEGSPLGAVQDLCGPRQFASRLDAGSYFNSGVLLVDLQAWKKEGLGEQAIQHLSRAEKLTFPDQDALNHVLAGRWLRLPLSWNFQPTAYAAVEKRYTHLSESRNELRSAIKTPKIIHYIGSNKPWHPMCIHPLRELFISYSQQTPWPLDLKIINKNLTFKQRLRLMLKKPKIFRRKRLTFRSC